MKTTRAEYGPYRILSIIYTDTADLIQFSPQKGNQHRVPLQLSLCTGTPFQLSSIIKTLVIATRRICHLSMVSFRNRQGLTIY